ncbi:Na+/H+-dicarboxylate symporter [Marinococcus luteus]|uniref:Na+/H+-dicarboxylate symporter n=1 Tax=Marinococcus luteus TaxID=1122204 RepID=A0A1H2WGH6_9BACI|nr:dicarboxylate/amino acid:cation symporter [Marinococcus luteus]SDW79631.1 Na+/H+-dicarboxylate symporter [Marinococcus luteus]
MNKKLTIWILIALVAGVIAGIILSFGPDSVYNPIDTYLLYPVGEIFLNLITMLVVPIVFVSITLGAAALNPRDLGRIGGKTIVFYLATTAIALTIGVIVAYVLQPGAGGDFDIQNASYDAEEAPSIADTLLGIIPDNPIQAMAEANMLQIIAFGIFIGISLAMLGSKVSMVTKFFEQLNDILMFLVTIVMYTAPFGAFALIASAIGEAGLDGLQSILMYALAVILALVLQAGIVYTLAISLLGKGNPLTFFREFFPAMAVAFSLSSSSGTLPISMRMAQERLKVSKPVSSFVQPLGSTINMDGTGIMQSVAAVFIAQAYSIDLSFTQVIVIILTATLASIGTAGVPGVGLIMLSLVLTQVGLPVEGIALIIGIDRLLDMLRTSLNVTGDAVCAFVIDRSEKRKRGEEIEHIGTE